MLGSVTGKRAQQGEDFPPISPDPCIIPKVRIRQDIYIVARSKRGKVLLLSYRLRPSPTYKYICKRIKTKFALACYAFRGTDKEESWTSPVDSKDSCNDIVLICIIENLPTPE